MCECDQVFTSKKGSLARRARNNGESLVTDPIEMAREWFQIIAKGGCDLGLKWLERLEGKQGRGRLNITRTRRLANCNATSELLREAIELKVPSVYT
ncbi:hypothetical protein GBA52_006041 [Prunus armeniaca]|nr:hypothetical protein GBA52_006041 [Prunus armeniaca]